MQAIFELTQTTEAVGKQGRDHAFLSLSLSESRSNRLRQNTCDGQVEATDVPPLQVASWTSWVRVLIFSLNVWICSVRSVFFVSRSL